MNIRLYNARLLTMVNGTDVYGSHWDYEEIKEKLEA